MENKIPEFIISKKCNGVLMEKNIDYQEGHYLIVINKDFFDEEFKDFTNEMVFLGIEEWIKSEDLTMKDFKVLITEDITDDFFVLYESQQ